MKPVLKLLAASALSAGMMIGGVVVASSVLSPEEDPHRFTGLDIKDLWTAEPVRIDRSRQTLERLPPRYASHVVMSQPKQQDLAGIPLETDADSRSPVSEIDLFKTASINDAATETGTNVLSPEHVSWCSARYRSYDPTDDTYLSFSGNPRSCTSPYQMDVTAAAETTGAEFITASDRDGEATAYAIDEEHIVSCSERYRSYRPTDNTYQPYGGGPRQPCQSMSF